MIKSIQYTNSPALLNV